MLSFLQETVRRLFGRTRSARPAAPVLGFDEVPEAEVIAAILSVPVHRMFSLLKDCKISLVKVRQTAATTEILSDTVDMQGYDSVAFIAITGDVDNTSVLTLTVKSNATDTTTGGTTEKAGTATTATATSADTKLIIVDVLRPSLRYVFASLTRTTANAVVEGMLAIQYNAKSMPVTQGSSVLTGDLGGPGN